ncbi:MAG: diguanylate cyclase [Syntrophaceae bacterium]|nr:diguanylate cyclase [Syntrophaceae bacterium]
MAAEADILFNYLRNVIYDPQHAELDVSSLPEEFQQLGKGLLYYVSCVQELTGIAEDLSVGKLNSETPSRGNEIASPLKSLQGSLRHLTWQAEQVAKGDYGQKVNFMGEFSNAFNEMTAQLDQRQKELLEEIATTQKYAKALSQSNELLAALAQRITPWIIVADKHVDVWHYVNRTPGAVLTDVDLEPVLREWVFEKTQEAADQDHRNITEFSLESNGAAQFFNVEIFSLRWGECDAVAFVLTDITDEKKRINLLQADANTDGLTSLPNRRHSVEVLDRWLLTGKAFCLCFVDVDSLKYVNDTYGHAEGDKYIVYVSSALAGLSDRFFVSRMGGDEFMLLAPGVSGCVLETMFEELRGSMGVVTDNGMTYRRSISYGIAENTEGDGLSAGKLLQLADERMYAYKRVRKIQR